MMNETLKAILYFSIFISGCNLSGKDNTNFEKLKEDAQHYYKTEDYYNAYQAYRLLVKKDSLNGEYFFRKGVCENQLAMYNSARESYANAIKLNYRVASSYFNMGLISLREQNDTLAMEYFQKCLIADPNHKDAATLYLGLQLKKHKIKKSI